MKKTIKIERKLVEKKTEPGVIATKKGKTPPAA
jgi:hypothetical protein